MTVGTGGSLLIPSTQRVAAAVRAALLEPEFQAFSPIHGELTLDDPGGQVGTFARSGTATVFDWNGVLQTAADGNPRMHGARLDGTDWKLDDGSGNSLHPTITEDGLTRFAQYADWPGASQAVTVGTKINPKTLDFGNPNLITDPEDLSGGGWGTTGTSTVADTTGPDGVSGSAQTVNDTDAAATSTRHQTNTITADSNPKEMSVRIKKDATGTICSVVWNLTGGTAARRDVHVDPSDGSTQAVNVAGTTSHTLTDIGDWYELTISCTNNNNVSAQVQIAPAAASVIGTYDATATGSNVFSGVKACDGTVGRYRYASEKGYLAAGNGHGYKCITAGTTGSLEPIWPVGTVGADTITDGTAVWQLDTLYRNPGLLHEATAVLNSCSDSSDFDPATTAWQSYGSGPTFLTDTGVDGVSRDNINVNDNSAGGQSGAFFAVTIADDSATHSVSYLVKKEADTSTFPLVGFEMTGGTFNPSFWHINKMTGETVSRQAPNTGTIRVVDVGDWWLLLMSNANNSTGNTTMNVYLGGADATVFGTTSGAATGATTFDKVTIALNTDVPPVGIETDGATATRAAETLNYDLANYSDGAGAIFADVTPLFASTDTAADHSILSFSTSAQTGFQFGVNEFVTNGTFDSDVSGWTNDATPTLTWNAGGYADIGRNGGGAAGQCYQTLSNLRIGETYEVSINVIALSNNVSTYIDQSDEDSNSSTGTHTRTFTATATSHRLDVSATGFINATLSVDDVSVKVATGVPLEIEDGTNSAVTAAQSWSTGDTLRCASGWSGTSMQATVDGTSGTAGTYDGAFASDTSLEVGQGNALPMILHNLVIYGRDPGQARLEALTDND